MKAGKLSSRQLENSVLGKIKTKREDVLLRPSVGEDCSAIEFGDYACILTTDPITGAASEVGKLGVHISCNDIASSGTAPIAILLTILAPVGTTIEEIEQVMEQASAEADKLNVEIIGGHTEITSAVNRIIVSTTAIGKMKKEDMIKTSGAKVGDIIVITKSAGIEGTGIIVYDKEDELLGVLNKDEIKTAKSLLDSISVVKEGVISGEVGVSALHDVTEGGLLGAIWEVCDASSLGATITYEEILIEDITRKICDHYKIDPLKLISSGSMVIACPIEKLEKLKRRLYEEDIKYSIIGEFIEEKNVFLTRDGISERIESPEKDDLFKVV
ncbi:MAG: AIR synthase family protein [Acidaminobacteraceae bacterium]